MKRTLIAALLALTLLLTVSCAAVAEDTPLLQIRLNETKWYNLDLTPYLMENNTWVTIPVEMDDLYELGNQIAVGSNCYNNNNRADKSVDLFFTMDADLMGDSFLSTDGMNNWDMFMDRYANIRLEMFDGEEWIAFPQDYEYRPEESTVAGLFVLNGTTYNMCRNIDVPELSKYQAARVAVNLHVGESLMEEPAPVEPDDPYVPTELDETNPVLKIKLNHSWTTLDLAAEKGNHNTWVCADLDYAKIITGNNTVSLDTNVVNPSNLTDQSVNVYFTFTLEPGDTRLSTDSLQHWVNYTDRFLNMYLEVRKAGTEEWVKLPGEETYRQDENTVVGLFTGSNPACPYNEQRIFFIEDAAAYDAARVYVNLHVGGDLTLAE